MGKDETFAHADKTQSPLDALAAVLRQGVDHEWHMRKMRVYAEALFARGPFQKGDRVKLVRTPEITLEKSWGWWGSRHFLVEGAMGVVVDVDFADDRFVAYVHFDDESWVHYATGVKHPVDRKGSFLFGESWLEKVT